MEVSPLGPIVVTNSDGGDVSHLIWWLWLGRGCWLVKLSFIFVHKTLPHTHSHSDRAHMLELNWSDINSTAKTTVTRPPPHSLFLRKNSVKMHLCCHSFFLSSVSLSHFRFIWLFLLSSRSLQRWPSAVGVADRERVKERLKRICWKSSRGTYTYQVDGTWSSLKQLAQSGRERQTYCFSPKFPSQDQIWQNSAFLSPKSEAKASASRPAWTQPTEQSLAFPPWPTLSATKKEEYRKFSVEISSEPVQPAVARRSWRCGLNVDRVALWSRAPCPWWWWTTAPPTGKL